MSPPNQPVSPRPPVPREWATAAAAGLLVRERPPGGGGRRVRRPDSTSHCVGGWAHWSSGRRLGGSVQGGRPATSQLPPAASHGGWGRDHPATRDGRTVASTTSTLQRALPSDHAGCCPSALGVTPAPWATTSQGVTTAAPAAARARPPCLLPSPSGVLTRRALASATHCWALAACWLLAGAGVASRQRRRTIATTADHEQQLSQPGVLEGGVGESHLSTPVASVVVTLKVNCA